MRESKGEKECEGMGEPEGTRLKGRWKLRGSRVFVREGSEGKEKGKPRRPKG